ncbi:ATP-binding protein [Nonomuraea sp. NPDC002799]
MAVPALVGREPELAALEQELAGGPALVLIEGEAGVGKSRLLREFLDSPVARRHRNLAAWCPPYREPGTLWPVARRRRCSGSPVTSARRAT